MNRELHLLFVDQFKRCAVTPAETVAVIAELGHKQDYVEAAVGAAQSLGASAIVLQAPRLSHPNLLPFPESTGNGVGALLAAAAECDFVVDVTVGGLIHSDVRTRITGRGKRMLFVAEPPEILRRLAGTPEIRTLVEAGADALGRGTTLHVTSEAGTDLTADISGDDLPITRQWGYVDEPGRWDHWPSGFIACFPKDRSGEGTIVLQRADVMLPWMRAIQDEVRLTVERGYIVDIAGKGSDAFMLKDYFESWNDPEAYALSHMGWGVHPVARFSALEVYDPHSLFGQEFRSAAGNFMWSTGANRFANRFTPAHLDIPMHSCTVRVDAAVVVDRGRLV
jgi:2,5-dihydroxypyridine 5,6-dioxygenase